MTSARKSARSPSSTIILSTQTAMEFIIFSHFVRPWRQPSNRSTRRACVE